MTRRIPLDTMYAFLELEIDRRKLVYEAFREEWQQKMPHLEAQARLELEICRAIMDRIGGVT